MDFKVLSYKLYYSYYPYSSNHLISYFCKTWLQLVFLRNTIRKRRKVGKGINSQDCDLASQNLL